MGDKDWDKFFDFIEKIVEARGLDVNQKTQLVVDEAKSRGDRVFMNFEEFASWDFSIFME